MIIESCLYDGAVAAWSTAFRLDRVQSISAVQEDLVHRRNGSSMYERRIPMLIVHLIGGQEIRLTRETAKSPDFYTAEVSRMQAYRAELLLQWAEALKAKV